jgi:amino acid transporter
MFFGAGERWPVWAVVMTLLAAVYIVLLSQGFSEAITLAEGLFLVGYIVISGIGVFVRRKRRQDG